MGDLASIQGGLPSFHIPTVPLTWDTLAIILPYALILSAIGLIESLLTLNLVGEITGKRGAHTVATYTILKTREHTRKREQLVKSKK